MRGRFALLGALAVVAGVGAAYRPAQARAATQVQAVPVTPPIDERVIGFDNIGRRMTVPATIGDQGPFQFVVDTGAERSVISSELAQSLDLPDGPPARLFDFTGASTVKTVHVPSISVGGFGAGAMEAPSLSMVNLGAAGMLGIDALQGQRIEIDFDRDQMKVTQAKHHPRGDFLVDAQLHVGQLIVTDARFEDQPIAVIVDTGSWVSVGNSAMRALAAARPRLLGPITITSVTGRSFDADYVTIDNLKIGGVRLDNFGLIFADVPPFERFGLADRPALILGMSSLRLFRRVEIDFANREIAFSLPKPPIDLNSACRSFSNCVVF